MAASSHLGGARPQWPTRPPVRIPWGSTPFFFSYWSYLSSPVYIFNETFAFKNLNGDILSGEKKIRKKHTYKTETKTLTQPSQAPGASASGDIHWQHFADFLSVFFLGIFCSIYSKPYVIETFRNNGFNDSASRAES